MLPDLKIQNPDDFGHVALLLGGTAAERGISLNSGAAVAKALKENGIRYTEIDPQDDNWIETLVNGDFARVFNIVHGRGGEDGQLQGLLELIDLPYTGSGVQASALTMDKITTKRVWQTLSIPTPEYAVIFGDQALNSNVKNSDEKNSDVKLAEQINKFSSFPAMVKPANEGSSIGMRKVNNAAELKEAIVEASQFDRDILVESFVVGREFTAAILGETALPLIELKTNSDFYDFEAKYKSNDTQYLCPCDLDEQMQKDLQILMLKAFQAVGAQGWGRVDFMLDSNNHPYLLEVNTVPGMTSHSLVPMAAKQAGADFNQLVWRILECTI